MALMQVPQQTRTAHGVTKTALDQTQSLEVVQTMLHGGVCILTPMCFIRVLTWFLPAEQPVLLAVWGERRPLGS